MTFANVILSSVKGVWASDKANGCGETYQVERPIKDVPLNEWIKYNPYNGKYDLVLSA